MRNQVPVRIWGSNLCGSSFAAPGTITDLKGVSHTWSDLLASLAVAQPAGRSAMGEGLANLPIGANLFIVMSANDEPTHENLGRVLARAGEAVAVRLEGFGEPQTAEDHTRSLEQAGASVLTCSPEHLEQTLTDLENLGQSIDLGAREAVSSLAEVGAAQL